MNDAKRMDANAREIHTIEFLAGLDAQLSSLGGIEAVLKMYDQRRGGVMERLERIKQDKGKDEAAKEQILSILFDDKEGAKRLAASTPAVPPRSCGQAERRPEPTNAADVPEAALMEELATEPTSAAARPLEVEFEEARHDRQGLKLLNAAIEALDKLDTYADGSNRIKRKEQTAIHDASIQLQSLRVREYVELVDWRKLEET